jgi:hypothetical protein
MLTRDRRGRWLAGVVLASALAAPASAQTTPEVFGYFSTRVEKSWNVPALIGDTIETDSPPKAFGHPFFAVMLRHEPADRVQVFVNLNGSTSGAVSVRNAWGEYRFSRAFSVRMGRIYRKFGLYNEVLDAVPSYYGIEPPETFDGDHLIISRTTTLMALGEVAVPRGRVEWSVATDNGEGSQLTGAVPVQGDLRVHLANSMLTLGASGYTSGGEVNSDVTVGSGSPKSGVLPWVAADSFKIWNAYAQATPKRFTLQAEVARASHRTRRDPEQVLEVVANAGINPAQRARFLVNPSGPEVPANVRVNGDYSVTTWYGRAGYLIDTRFATLGPYIQLDRYRNPETIANKLYGGDDEAGQSDDGIFVKFTTGIVIRPTPAVAAKLDGSVHRYRLNGRSVNYAELRFDVSFMFGL